MKKQVATFLLSLLLTTHCSGISLEFNTSYDYFRGLPDGSWNGNNGLLIAGNSGMNFEYGNIQLGGSYGVYNWDGRNNLVFANPKTVEQIGFLTVGGSTSFCSFNLGLLYDRMFSSHFGIFDLSPSIDQLRFQIGYQWDWEEFGVWGTTHLKRVHKTALGIPVVFQALGQLNLFWSHYFCNGSQTMLFAGFPYQDSLMFPHQRSGRFIAGFSFRVPLCESLFLDGNGSYMLARSSPGPIQSRNYAASICVGLTYFFSGSSMFCSEAPYMSLANHTNFFIDTNTNQ